MQPRMKEAADDDFDDDDEDLVADGVSSLTVDEPDSLDCGVCCLPLKPPIFQCIHGHAVCCACHDKLKTSGKGRCPVCRVGMGDKGFIRCYAMERLVDAVHGPCPHAAHGCTARPAYHDRRAHRRSCPYAPHACPFGACGFAGPAGALVAHLSGAHCGEEPVRRFWARELRDAMASLRLRVAAGEEEEDAMVPSADVDLIVRVLGSAGVSRADAIRALKESGGDIPRAVKELAKKLLLVDWITATQDLMQQIK
ncbi:unnamed protein product [Urochloa humidicola]